MREPADGRFACCPGKATIGQIDGRYGSASRGYMMRVLLVEDDRMIGQSLDLALSSTGLAVDWVQRGTDGLTALTDVDYGVLLLDIGLPDQSGVEILRQMRERGDTTPVVIITARDDVDSRIAGLDGGADDYVIKPFDFEELHARIRAV